MSVQQAAHHTMAKGLLLPVAPHDPLKHAARSNAPAAPPGMAAIAVKQQPAGLTSRPRQVTTALPTLPTRCRVGPVLTLTIGFACERSPWTDGAGGRQLATGVEDVADRVPQVLLEPQDEVLAFCDLVGTGARLLEPTQLGYVRAQVRDQAIQRPLAGHDSASNAG